MKREIITISENGNIHISTTTIWIYVCEIADLLVFYRTNSVIFSSCSEKMFSMRIEKDTMLFHKDCLVKLCDIDVSV